MLNYCLRAETSENFNILLPNFCQSIIFLKLKTQLSDKHTVNLCPKISLSYLVRQPTGVEAGSEGREEMVPQSITKTLERDVIQSDTQVSSNLGSFPRLPASLIALCECGFFKAVKYCNQQIRACWVS